VASIQEATSVDKRYVLLKLANGNLVVIFPLDMELPVSDIKKALASNTPRGIHTLFLLDEALFPDEGDIIRPGPYFAALHTVYHEKIYAYRLDKHAIEIFPVQFTWQGESKKRRVVYRSPVELGDLRCEFIDTSFPHIKGFWATISFQARVKWEPNYSYFERRRQHQQRQSNQHTGNVAQKLNSHALKRYYTLLNVEIDASVEQIRRAYHQQARRYHPDLNPTPQAKEYMQAINQAYHEILRHLDVE
jgi:hypothetical protein